ncbi:MAG: segregation and condensation protein [Frankiaceae bacterium]|jgi:segregation and condensation protein B|nr:segregation and condensation protein [Frankiaceae bacterium]
MTEDPRNASTDGVSQVPPAPDVIDITSDALAAAPAQPSVSPREPSDGSAEPPARTPERPLGTPEPLGGTAEPHPASAADPDEPAPPLRKIIEAILLVVDQPVPDVDLAQVVEAPRATVLETLEALAAAYEQDDRGFELRQVAGGWRLYTAPDCAPYIERFVLEGQQARLTQAALETLAVIAYRQPVGRQSVAAIRGVNVDGVVRTLLTRGLIAEAGEEGPSGAHLYVTTPYFLERLGLRSLDELPNLAPLLPVNLDDLADHA